MPTISCHFESLLHWSTATDSAFDLTQAHLWKVNLKENTVLTTAELACISPAEMARANRFMRNSDKRLFLSTRVATRNILAQYLGLAAVDITFTQYGNGKPSVEQSIYPGFDFNIAHSGTCILVAIAQGRVGVDVEYINPTFNPETLLSASLSPHEIEHWRANDDQLATFYKFWTRKEAILKMNGIGITHGLTHIPCQDGKHRVSQHDTGTNTDLNVVSFFPSSGHMGSLCLPEHIEFSCWMY